MVQFEKKVRRKLRSPPPQVIKLVAEQDIRYTGSDIPALLTYSSMIFFGSDILPRYYASRISGILDRVS